jgi:hypothetical protein
LGVSVAAVLFALTTGACALSGASNERDVGGRTPEEVARAYIAAIAEGDADAVVAISVERARREDTRAVRQRAEARIARYGDVHRSEVRLEVLEAPAPPHDWHNVELEYGATNPPDVITVFLIDDEWRVRLLDWLSPEERLRPPELGDLAP